MSTQQELDDAIAIFRELGWDGASQDQTPDLPIGTPEQQRRAVAGLKSGEWGHWGEFPDARGARMAWVNDLDVDQGLLGIFAARVGVAAPRAIAVLPGAYDAGDDLLAKVLIPRGPGFAAAFIKSACVSSRRAWEHATSAYGGVAVRLADAHDLPVPESVEYLKDWVVYAAIALAQPADMYPKDRNPLAPEVSRRRYLEHVRAAVGVGLPVTGPFGGVFGAAVTAGWVDRAEAVELAFTGLDSAQRPGDRKGWAQILDEDLAVTDTELAARADALVPVLASGEAAVVERFGPRLVTAVEDHQLADILSVALLAKTKKAQRLVIAAAAQRPRPSTAAVDAIAPLLSPLTTDGDRQISRAASAVFDAWQVAPEPVTEWEQGEAQARGLWQATPPLWQPPRFELGEVSVGALTDSAAILTGRPEGATDLESERFLALANEVARRDPEQARIALRGVRPSSQPGLRWIAEWVKGTDPRWGYDRLEPAATPTGFDRLLRWTGMGDDAPRGTRDGRVEAPLTARDWVVVRLLGTLPVLLSQPSFVDLRIDPADLLDRLRMYAEAKVDVREPDLQLALLRTDVTLASADLVRGFKHVKIAVRLQSGEKVRRNAGQLVLDYLKDPVVETPIKLHARGGYWQAAPAATPKSLADLPNRLAESEYLGFERQMLFPTWGEAALLELPYGEDATLGITLRQHARRTTPLPPGAVANMIAAQRAPHARAAADCSIAVDEAWQRGLLREVDTTYLDAEPVPSSLAALARAGLEVSEQGVASIVWRILDQVVIASAKQTKVLAGTAEVIDALVTLLPEAMAAVEQGIAEPSVLDLPGVRTIGARSGSSRAVERARALVALLPEAAVPEGAPRPDPVPEVPVLQTPLGKIWRKASSGAAAAVPDGAHMRVGAVERRGTQTMLYLDLKFEHLPGLFRVVKGWTYDLENEGQCAATAYPDAETPPPYTGNGNCYLRWDRTQIVVSQYRDWHTDKDVPLSRRDSVPPLTTSMVAVFLVGLCHDGDWALGHTRVLRGLTDRGKIGSAAVTHVLPALLSQPDISPARMAGHLKKEPGTLPVLWPVLVESVRFAAEQPSPPRWVNQVLDVAIWFSPQLREAAANGWIPAEQAAWPGLTKIAALPAKSAAVGKAKTLLAQLALPA